VGGSSAGELTIRQRPATRLMYGDEALRVLVAAHEAADATRALRRASKIIKARRPHPTFHQHTLAAAHDGIGHGPLAVDLTAQQILWSPLY
jgi:hypothetical protein